MDSADVLFTWERMKKQGQFRTELSNELNPGAPIVSMTAPDAKTVVIKLAEPNATVFSLLGTDALGYLFISPRKPATAWDPDKRPSARARSTQRTTLKSRTAGSATRTSSAPKLKNNEPYLDEIFEPVIPDISAAEAQFRSGAVYWYGVSADNIIQTKRDTPALIMYATSTRRSPARSASTSVRTRTRRSRTSAFALLT